MARDQAITGSNRLHLVKNQDNYFDCPYHRSLWLVQANDQLSDSLLKACHRMLEFLARLCNIDLRQCNPEYLSVGSIRKGSLLMEFRKRYDGRPIRKLSIVVFILILVHLSCNIYYQYRYDFTRFKLKRLKNFSKFMANGYANHSALHMYHLAELKSHMDEMGRVLQLIGNPHMHLTFVSEYLYVACIFVTVTTYMLPQIFIVVRGKLSCYFVRNIVDYDNEMRSFDMIVDQEVEKFLVSSRFYKLAMERLIDNQRNDPTFENLLALSTNAGLIHFNEMYTCNVSNSYQIHQEIEMSRFLDAQVIYWKSNHLLRPFNRSPIWIRQWARIMFIFIICSIFNSIIVDTALAYVLLTKMGKKASGWNWLAQMITLSELFVFLLVASIALIYYGGSFLLSCLDQLKLLRKLESFTKCITYDSRMKFKHLNHASTNLFWEDHLALISDFKERLNAELLYILMHYKITQSQHRHLKVPFALTLSTGLAIIFIYPILCRVHLPYLDIHSDGDSYRLLMVISLLLVPPYTTCVISMCCHYNSFVRLFRALANYLAHIIDVEQNFGSNYKGERRDTLGSEMYNSHLVSQLRKLVSHPENLGNEFAIKSIFIKFTYNNVIRVYFWLGLIIISIIYYARQEQNSATNPSILSSSVLSLLDDPFGLY